MRIWGLFMNSEVCIKDMNKNIEISKEISESLLSLIDDVQEKTIFSIGGRGYYEDPTSDVLAFYLDPNEEHGLGDLVLQSLVTVSAMGDKIRWNKDAQFAIYREVSTNEKNRIDLLIECDEWVLVIENKIYHEAINPFKDYERYIEDEYENIAAHFILLSPKDSKINDVGEVWKSVNYKDFIEKIESDLGFTLIKQPINKWHFFLRDFLLNLKQYSEENNMSADKINDDIKKIHERYIETRENSNNLKELLKYFFEQIEIKTRHELNKKFKSSPKFTGKIHTNQNPSSVYFYPDGKNKVRLAIYPNEEEEVGCSLWLWFSDKVKESERAKLSRRVGITKWKSEGTASEERIKGAYKSVDEAIQALVKFATKIYPTKP